MKIPRNARNSEGVANFTEDVFIHVIGIGISVGEVVVVPKLRVVIRKHYDIPGSRRGHGEGGSIGEVDSGHIERTGLEGIYFLGKSKVYIGAKIGRIAFCWAVLVADEEVSLEILTDGRYALIFVVHQDGVVQVNCNRGPVNHTYHEHDQKKAF